MYGRPDNRMNLLGGSAGAAPPRLDRAAALPLYAQLRDALLDEVRHGGLQPGDRFPTEAAIQARYQVSRATVRQALDALEADGVIRRAQGLGTFVSAPRIRHVPLLTSFAELASSQGFRPSHRVLSSSRVAIAADEAADIGWPAGADCRHLRRLFLVDGNPVGLAETWLPLEALQGHDELFEADRLQEGSLYELMQSPPIGLVLDHAVETISSGVIDAPSARLLACRRGTPALLIRRLTYTPTDRAVELTRLLFVGERYEYRVELHRPTVGDAR
jgi:GntR family transcriptional regulator